MKQSKTKPQDYLLLFVASPTTPARSGSGNPSSSPALIDTNTNTNTKLTYFLQRYPSFPRTDMNTHPVCGIEVIRSVLSWGGEMAHRNSPPDTARSKYRGTAAISV